MSIDQPADNTQLKSTRSIQGIYCFKVLTLAVSPLPLTRTPPCATLHTMQSHSAKAPTQQPPKPSRPSDEQRAAFYIALGHGHSIRKASDMVGINRNTGASWAKQAKVRQAEQQARANAIATKTAVLVELTRLGLHDKEVAPRDKVAALIAVNRAMGYEAPARSEQVIIHATVNQYLEAQRQLLKPDTHRDIKAEIPPTDRADMTHDPQALPGHSTEQQAAQGVAESTSDNKPYVDSTGTVTQPEE